MEESMTLVFVVIQQWEIGIFDGVIELLEKLSEKCIFFIQLPNGVGVTQHKSKNNDLNTLNIFLFQVSKPDVEFL